MDLYCKCARDVVVVFSFSFFLFFCFCDITAVERDATCTALVRGQSTALVKRSKHGTGKEVTAPHW